MSIVKKLLVLAVVVAIARATRSAWRQISYDNQEVKASGYPRRRIGGLPSNYWAKKEKLMRGDGLITMHWGAREPKKYPNRGNQRSYYQQQQPIGGIRHASRGPWTRRCVTGLDRASSSR